MSSETPQNTPTPPRAESPLKALMRRLPGETAARREKLKAAEDARAETERLREKATTQDEDWIQKIRNQIQEGPGAEQRLLQDEHTMIVPPEIAESAEGAIQAITSKQEGVAFSGEGVHEVGGEFNGPKTLPGTVPELEIPAHIIDTAIPEKNDVAGKPEGMFHLGDLHRQAEAQGRQDLSGLQPEEIDALFAQAQSGAMKQAPGTKTPPRAS